jgi:hypothetical protein
MPPHPTSWRYVLILSSHLCLGLLSGLFPSGFPTKTLITSTLPHRCYMPRSFHSYSRYAAFKSRHEERPYWLRFS